MRGPERLARTVLVVSLALATSLPLAWTLTTPPADAGTLPAAGPTSPQRPAADDAERTMAEPPVETAQRSARVEAEREPGPSTRSARIDDLAATSDTVPTRLRIPGIDVDARVVTVGVENDGEMEVPGDVDDVGWYRHGPAPGEPGAAVVAGHVDSREQGPGAFFALRTLDVGARVVVTDSAGDVQSYEVVARRRYAKSKLPADELFSREGPPRLVLITCGGDFDRDAGSYRANVVIYAEPSSG